MCIPTRQNQSQSNYTPRYEVFGGYIGITQGRPSVRPSVCLQKKFVRAISRQLLAGFHLNFTDVLLTKPSCAYRLRVMICCNLAELCPFNCFTQSNFVRAISQQLQAGFHLNFTDVLVTKPSCAYSLHILICWHLAELWPFYFLHTVIQGSTLSALFLSNYWQDFI